MEPATTLTEGSTTWITILTYVNLNFPLLCQQMWVSYVHYIFFLNDWDNQWLFKKVV